MEPVSRLRYKIISGPEYDLLFSQYSPGAIPQATERENAVGCCTLESRGRFIPRVDERLGQ